MIGTCANILGVGLGFLVPGFMVSEFKTSETYTDDQLQSFRVQIKNMLILLSSIASVITLLCAFTFQEKPLKPPPQENQLVVHTERSESIKKSEGTNQSDAHEIKQLGFGSYDEAAYNHVSTR